MKINSKCGDFGVGKMIIAVRVRGTTDISRPQKIILSKLNLKKINTAVFLQGTPQNIRLLKKNIKLHNLGWTFKENNFWINLQKITWKSWWIENSYQIKCSSLRVHRRRYHLLGRYYQLNQQQWTPLPINYEFHFSFQVDHTWRNFSF